MTVNGQPEDSEPKTKHSRQTLNLSPMIPYLKALQSLQKEDRLRAGGAYVDRRYLVVDGLGSPCPLRPSRADLRAL